MELLKLIAKVEQKYHKKFHLHYVTAPQPNPAWCVGNHVYINNEYSNDEIFLPGMIAHELGHAISGISHFTFIPSLKVSTMLSRILYITIVAMFNSKKIFLKVISYILFFPYYLINLNNIIFTFHFLREDEITANNIAVELGYGEFLRSYYAIAKLYEEDVFLRKCDFYHPSIAKMIDLMNCKMGIKKDLIDIYYIENKLILANIKTKTFIVPSFITEICSNAISNKELIKIKSKFVTKVHAFAFKNNLKLEEICFENVKEFPIAYLNRLNNLETIKINDLNILENIYKTYPNKLFSNKIYKVLVKNEILKDV